MNVYDSERMESSLAPHGFEAVQEPDGADVVILNTCHIREKAAEKVYSDLGRIRKQKTALAEQGQRMIIVVAGCVAQAEGKEIIRRAPYVDIVIGTQAVKRLPEMVANAYKMEKNLIELDFSTDEKFDMLNDEYDAKGVTAFLTIQEGCDKFCTYCVVPYTRGAEISRPVMQIFKEAEHLAASGVKDITLLGQNVNAFHGMGPDFAKWDMAQLMEKLGEIDGLERIRYTTSHPQDMKTELLLAHRDNPKVMPYLHLPVQSGSNRILKAMNRKHTAEEYLATLEELRGYVPDIALSSDFIVGFPGETDEDFNDTLELVKKVNYTQTYSFMYSPRPGTPGALMDDDVPLEVKKHRLQQLQNLLNEQQYNFNKQTVGKKLLVLLEKEGRHEGQLIGRTPYQQAISLDADTSYIGKICEVLVTKAAPNSLTGELVAESIQQITGTEG